MLSLALLLAVLFLAGTLLAQQVEPSPPSAQQPGGKRRGEGGGAAPPAPAPPQVQADSAAARETPEAGEAADPAGSPSLRPSGGDGSVVSLPADADAAPGQAGSEANGAPPEDPCAAGADEPVGRPRHSWDPRAGYGLCAEVCGQDEACVDGRCLARCSPSCREGTYCTPAGECLPLPAAPQAEPTEEELQSRLGRPSRNATKAAVLDLGGVLFRGARPSFEWGRQHAFQVRAVFMNTGVMSYFLGLQTEYERFEWGFGASVGYRRYEAKWGNLRGFYYGAGLDYAVTEVRDESQGRYVAYTHYAGGHAEFGYRWVFDHFLFGFGPSLGTQVPFYNGFSSTGPDGCTASDACPVTSEPRFEGNMVVEIGWFQ